MMRALRERNFRLYWLGQAVSNTGNWMQIVALGWFILQLNGSPIALGWLGLAQFLPIAALSLAGGVLADRFPRRSLLLVTQSIAMMLAGLLALLAWSGKPPLWSLLLMCGVSFGLMLLLFALTPTLLLALPLLTGCGMGATMSLMVANTLLQTQAPPGMRGRVMSLYTLIAAGFTQAGVLIISGLSVLISLSGATVAAGLVVALAVTLGVRSIRWLARRRMFVRSRLIQ